MTLANLKDLIWICEQAQQLCHQRSEPEWEARAKRYKEDFQRQARALETDLNKAPMPE